MTRYPEKILVIEENEIFRSSLRRFLEDLGYRVTETGVVEGAVELAAAVLPDLIFINLSDDSDLGVIYNIRKEDELSGIPVLASSNNGSLGIELFSGIDKLGSGFIGYLTKSNNFTDLADNIELILHKRKTAA